VTSLPTDLFIDKQVKSKVDHGQPKELSPPPSPPPLERLVPDDKKSLAKATMTSQLTSFFCAESYIHLEPGVPADLQVKFKLCSWNI